MNKKQLHEYIKGSLESGEELRIQMQMADMAGDEKLLEMLDSEFNDMNPEPGLDIRRPLAGIKKQLGFKNAHRMVTGAIRVFVCICALACIPLSVLLVMKTQPAEAVSWQQTFVPEGERAEVVLPDGSIFSLNGGSSIIYPDKFYGDCRKVFVEGQVYAKVSPDASKPFYLCSAESEVKVLGTRFEFKNYKGSEHAELMLLEGKVDYTAVGTARQTVSLCPGDMMVYDKTNHKISLSRFNPESYATLDKYRSFYFMNITLKDIANELQASFGVPIYITDASAAGRRYFALFTNGESLDEILSTIGKDDRLKVSRTGTGYNISLKKSIPYNNNKNSPE
ncbi:MAG: FecR domain-containing protein [Bacteroidales bacterium]|jgi:ferric-dicitrate binding protein FerR (iron transport regulator)|nr:FecR domain-containing protein [Bacteroidales bacterium]MCI2132967.1 FecR domain-containing protein [Bacteroidales bacterium]